MRMQKNTRSGASVRREIRAQWAEIVERAGVRPESIGALPMGAFKLLGSSTKIEAGEGVGVLSAVVYMSPAREAFTELEPRKWTLCPNAGSCAVACLGHNSGRMIFDSLRLARLWKATLFLGARHLFRELLDIEADAHEARAARLGMIPAVRVDGSSDTGEGELAAKRAWARGAESIRWYDYTKNPARARRSHDGYRVVYSYSERSRLVDVDAIVRGGGSVAVVFSTRKGEPLPRTWRGHRVVDGDAHDARFLDAPGVVVGLSFKAAKARQARLAEAIAGGFVVDAATLALAA